MIALQIPANKIASGHLRPVLRSHLVDSDLLLAHLGLEQSLPLLSYLVPFLLLVLGWLDIGIRLLAVMHDGS